MYSSFSHSMEPTAQADEPPEPATRQLERIMGTAIAIFTLVTPLYTIASYSSATVSLIPAHQLQPLSRQR